MKQISAEEFQEGYIRRSGMTEGWYQKNFVTMRCTCGDEMCQGYAAVRNDEHSISVHKELYMHEVEDDS